MDQYYQSVARKFPEDELLLPLSDEYTRPQSWCSKGSASSSVRDAADGFNTSSLLLTQIHEKAKIKVVSVELINVADIIGLHFFAGNLIELDHFLTKEAEDVVTFRKYFLALFKPKQRRIVDEVSHFQPNFTLFIDRLIQKLGSGNLVKSINGDIKSAELYVNERSGKEVIPRLVSVSGAADLFVSVVCRVVCVQSTAAAPAPGQISDEISALAGCFGSVAVAAPGESGLSACMLTRGKNRAVKRVGREVLNHAFNARSMYLRSATKVASASLKAQADSCMAPSASPKPTGVIIESSLSHH